MNKILIFFIIAIINGSLLFAQKTGADRFSGNWTGKGFQYTGNQTWLVNLSADSQKKTFLAFYPGLGCTADWEMTYSDDFRAEFVQKITDGKDKCLSGLKVVLTPTDNEFINAVWFDTDEKPCCFATLKREQPAWLAGKWTGTGYQPGNGSTWSMELFFDTDKLIATVKYPSLNCSGEWILKSADDNSARFEEKITNGLTRCVSESVIRINRIDQNTVYVSWFSEQIIDIDAYTVLTRSKK